MPTVLFVEVVCVACGEDPAAETLQVGMGCDSLNKPFAETLRTILFVDEDIAEVGEDGVIADDARDADLLIAVIETEYKRVAERAFGAFARSTRCPVGACEEVTDGIYVESCWVCADGEIVFVCFKKLWHGASLSWVILFPSLRPLGSGLQVNGRLLCPHYVRLAMTFM
jgi:hypothetical protein